MDMNLVPIWVSAPESNPSDVKGEGTRKNNMEITWTVSVPQPSLGGSRVHPGPLALYASDTPRPQAGSDGLAGLVVAPLRWASRNQAGGCLDKI